MEHTVRCRRQRQKTSSIFFSFFNFFICSFVRSFFYFFRSVINKPTEQHVAYQWAKRLWCWSYKMFLLYTSLFSRWLHPAIHAATMKKKKKRKKKKKMLPNILLYTILWKQKHCISYCINGYNYTAYTYMRLHEYEYLYCICGVLSVYIWMSMNLVNVKQLLPKNVFIFNFRFDFKWLQ